MSEAQSPATPMHAIWKFLQHSQESVFDLELITAVAGREVIDALLRARVLIPAGIAGAPRSDNTKLDCERLDASDELVAFDVPRLVTMLQRLYHVDGGPALFPGLGHPKGVFLLGTTPTDWSVTEVFFAPDPMNENLVWFLVGRRCVRARTLVLVPTILGVPDALLLQHHHPGKHVEVRFLEPCVNLRDGEFVMSQRAWPVESQHPPKPFCAILEGTARRNLSQPEYHALIAVGAYDLLIDKTITVAGGLYRCFGRREGQSWEARLSASELAVVVQLITSGRAMRPDEFRLQSGRQTLASRIRLIERARSKIDVDLGHRQWRLIQTLSADTARDKRYFFNPPPGFRCAILVPFGGEESSDRGGTTVVPVTEQQPQ